MRKKVWYAPNKFESYGEKEIKAVEECLRDGWIAGFGPRSIKFEELVAQYFGKKYGVFVNSGSSACLLALASLQLPKGSEVITPACTFSTTVAPMVQLGLKPIFCDVGIRTYVPSVQDVINLITENTRVIMIPNLIGNKPDWKAIREHLVAIDREDIILIEDSADTMTYTPESDISTTSFYASHVITAGGSGGMVMFNSEKLRDVCLQFRDWGRIGNNAEEVDQRFNHSVDGIPYDFKFLYGVLGYNFKSSEMNAAFGLVQLERLDKFVQIRRDKDDEHSTKNKTKSMEKHSCTCKSGFERWRCRRMVCQKGSTRYSIIQKIWWWISRKEVKLEFVVEMDEAELDNLIWETLGGEASVFTGESLESFEPKPKSSNKQSKSKGKPAGKTVRKTAKKNISNRKKI